MDHHLPYSEAGPDSLKKYNATKPAINVGPSLARQRNAILFVSDGKYTTLNMLIVLHPVG